MRRFFVSEALKKDSVVTVSGDDAHHISRVLRMQIADVLFVADCHGGVAKAKIRKIEESRVTADVLELLEWNTESPVHVTLAQCLPKGDKMDFIVQKAVELGVSQVLPLVSEHCVVKYDDKKKAARREKWQKVAHEAAKQCGRTILPEVLPITPLRVLLQNLPAETHCFMCYEGERERPFKELLKSVKGNKFLVLIGPEGGFSKEEAALCNSRGVMQATLGPRILRAETAAIAAVGIILYEKGDLGGML